MKVRNSLVLVSVLVLLIPLVAGCAQPLAVSLIGAASAAHLSASGYPQITLPDGASDAWWGAVRRTILQSAYDLPETSSSPVVGSLADTPAWAVEGNQADARFGASVGTAGDVNGDGYDDIIVGAWRYSDDQTFEGRAYVYHGSAAGPSTSPDWTAEGDQAGALLGRNLGTAGDVNGDGYDDVIVGAGEYDNGQTGEGGAFVYHGSETGLGSSPAWTAESDQANAHLGHAVATAGDVNGDGYDDVIVGAHGFTNDQTREGRAFVYLGSAAGLNASPVWTADGDQVDSLFGYAVGTAGDVDGDGYDDIIVGAQGYDNDLLNEGRVFVYLGSATGPGASAAWRVEGNQASIGFGAKVGTAGDVDGDGYDDVILHARHYDDDQLDEGRAFVYLGSALGLGSDPAWTADSDQEGTGCSEARTAGDVNADGYDDVIVGVAGWDNGETDEGRAAVYYGSAAGLSAVPNWVVEGDQPDVGLGMSVGTAGDVNGDGNVDLIVGVHLFDHGETDEGQALVYYGVAEGVSTTPNWTAESDVVGASLGFFAATAGDVNGDGYDDVIAGAPNYSDGQTSGGRVYAYYGSATGLSATPSWTVESDQAGARLGNMVSTAGDVNGDGYDDVIVGAPRYDSGQSDEGRAYVYHGSPTGLEATPRWVAESNQSGSLFGAAVYTAGDVNGDGYDDVAVGARFYDNGQSNEGRAFVYYGSATGLGAAAAWTAESDQGGALFGTSLGTAGDVNGDGYDDLVVGAYWYDNGQSSEGRAYVYHGSATGLSLSADWSAEGNQAGAWFGDITETAGDVNGDGYDDVLIGAWAYDHGETDEGRAFLYYGGPAGLGTSPAWTAESNQIDARFSGYSAATAGDINSDGYDDIIIGAPHYDNGQTDEGRAFVYYGSATGVSATPAWTVEADQDYAYLGDSGTAGDVNGDGMDDLIVAARGYTNGEIGEGKLFVYYGYRSSPPNQPPGVGAGGPYTVNEGASIAVSASGSDPDGDLLTYAWDLDNDGIFETAGQSATLSAAALDGPTDRLIQVQVTDPEGLTAVDQATVNVLNVAPTAAFANTSGVILEGTSATLAFSDPFDSGEADSAAGLNYSYDCTGDGAYEATGIGVTSFACAYPEQGIYVARGRIADKDGGSSEYAARVTVVDGGTDLSVRASDVTFAPDHPAAGATVLIQALVSYRGLTDASGVRVRFYDADTLLEEVSIPTIGSGETTAVSVQATFPDPSFRLIRVVVDPEDSIAESDEDNNEAAQLLQVGEPDLSDAAMVVQAASLSACRGQLTSVSGSAYYDLASIPGEQDHPVQGGRVVVRIVDPQTGSVLAQFAGAHTNIHGQFSQGIVAPSTDGAYPIRIEVTDNTISQEIEVALVVSGACPSQPPTPPPPPDPGGDPEPPAPNTPPEAVQDVYLFSEDIYFGNENPDKGEPITIFAYVHYYGTLPASDVRVTVYDLFPLNGVLNRYEIGSTLVSYPDAGSSSPAVVSLPWTNSQEGAHVIQVVAEPPFSQFTENDKATRAIFVGPYPQVYLNKTVELLVDADGDGQASPGDTLGYTLEYGNSGTTDVTGATLIDDWAETLLEVPTNLTGGGVVAEGTITWDLGTIPAGASGLVSYEIQIVPEGEFPTGRTRIVNIALLDGEETAPVVAQAEIEGVANLPPSADAGGPYSGDEGSPIALDGAAADPDGDSLAFAWTVGSELCAFSDASVIDPTLTCADQGSYEVTLAVSDGTHQPVTDSATVTVYNLPPAVSEPAVTPEPSDEGSPVTASATWTDPGVEDAPFTCTVDYGDGSGPQAATVSGDTCAGPEHTYADNGSYTVTIAVTDKDGGEGGNQTTHVVNNVAPAVSEIVAALEPIPSGTQVDASAGFTDPGVLDTHTAVWDWGEGAPSEGVVDEAHGSGTVSGSHIYGTPGVYTVRVTVTDKDGDGGESVYQYVVVYDLAGGFVTGGGWIDSPAGAYPEDPSLIGKANFGFVSKYDKGTETLTGQTEFRFKAGDLSFYSSSYQWLVVAGANAKYKGEGTINGEGAYGFLLTATDAALTPSTQEDLFRIKIWDLATEQVVYDNQLGADDDGYEGTEIGGGNIKVHKK